MVVVAQTVAGVLFVLVGGYALFGGLKFAYGLGYYVLYMVRFARSEPIPVSDVEDATPPIEFEGTAKEGTGELIEAPLSETECLAAQVESNYRVQSDDSWTTDVTAVASAPFVVADGGHRIGVAPDGAHWSFADADETIRLNHNEYLDESVLDRLDTVAFDDPVDAEELDGVNERRLIERRLDPGDDVHVVTSEIQPRDRDWGEGPRLEAVDGTLFEITQGTASDHRSERRTGLLLFCVFTALILLVSLAVTVAGLALLYGAWIA